MVRTKKVGGRKSIGKRPKFKLPATPSTSARAAAPPITAEQRKHKHRFRPGTRAIMEIRKYQRSTDLLIRKLPFARLVRQICNEYYSRPGEEFRWQASAIEALQVASEDYLVRMFEGRYRIVSLACCLILCT